MLAGQVVCRPKARNGSRLIGSKKTNSRGEPSASPAVRLSSLFLVARRRRRRRGALGHRGLAECRLDGRSRGHQRAVGGPGDVATPGLVPKAPAVVDRVPVAVAVEVIAVALVRAVEAAVVEALAVRLAEGLRAVLVGGVHAV